MYHYLGRGQCVRLLPVLSLLVFLQDGFEFCVLAYSSSLFVCEFTFSLRDWPWFQNIRVVLSLVGEKDQASPLSSLFLSPVCFFLVLGTTLGAESRQIWSLPSRSLTIKKHWLFGTGYIIFKAWYKMQMQGPLLKNYWEFEMMLAEHQAKHPSERWVLCIFMCTGCTPRKLALWLFIKSTLYKESNLFLPHCPNPPYPCVWELSSLRTKGWLLWLSGPVTQRDNRTQIKGKINIKQILVTWDMRLGHTDVYRMLNFSENIWT